MKLTSKISTTFTFHLVITEGEMRALDALVGYGFDSFIKVFYEKLGKHYMETHHEDLKKLFKDIEALRPHLEVVDKFKKEGAEFSEKYKI